MTDRKDSLGFCPQKESPYNRLLPYADVLDEESNQQLAEIKSGLGNTILLRDLKIGGSHWTGQLAKYIRLYGCKFSKEDHITFIKILYELIITPDLGFSLIPKFSQLFISLLKKRSLLSRDDLVLAWRPLYELLEKVAYSHYEHHGLILFPGNIEAVLKNVIRCARIYFPSEATAEMLQEWRPLLCPFDVTMLKGAYFLELFLPTCILPIDHENGFKLWFKEIMTLWESNHNSPSWEKMIVELLARLSNTATGYVDWEPYVSHIFSRFLRSLSLPVGSAQVAVDSGAINYDINVMSWWIIGMLGGGSSVMDHLKKLFISLESFYHPSNYGRWSVKLLKLMHKLASHMVTRVHRERYKKTWQPSVPEWKKLTDADIVEFVKTMQPIVLLAMFSKLGAHEAASTFQYLSILCPEIIIPPLLERTYPALETLTEPHRLIACLQCTVATLRSMVGNSKTFSQGRMHVLPLLNLSLPGIDPNDMRKCLVTFQLVSTLSSLVPLVDCSQAVHLRDDLNEDEKELCLQTAQFEDFVLQFVDRILGLIENSAQEHCRTDTSSSEKLTHEESMIEIGLFSTFSAIVQQSSDQIYMEILKRITKFVTTSIMEIRIAGKFASDIVRSIVKLKPESALKMLVPHFSEIVLNKASRDDISEEEHLDNEFLWNLKLLSEVVRCDGNEILKYREELVQVLDTTLHLKCKDAAELSGNLLRHLLRANTLLYAVDHRSTTTDWNLPLSDNLPVRQWGVSGNVENLGMKWHIPSTEEIKFAKDLLDRFLLPELESIRQHICGGKSLSREELLQTLSIVMHCIVGAASSLPVWSGEPITLIDSMSEMKRFNHTAAMPDNEISLDGKNVRELVANTMKPLLEYLLENSEDDTKNLVQLLKVYNSLLFSHGTQKSDFDGRWKSLKIVKRSLENKLHGKKSHIRALLIDRIQLQHELRLINKTAKTFTPLHQSMFKDMFRLSVSRYMKVRKIAQSLLASGFHLYAYAYRSLLDDILENLKADPIAEHHQIKGSLYVIFGESKRSLVSKRSWEVVNKVWPALVSIQHAEKPSILRLVDTIIDKLHKNMETTEISITAHDSLLDSCKLLWTSNNYPAPAGTLPSESELQSAKTMEEKRNSTALESYYQLMKKLADLIESGKLMWKYHEIALEMLSLLARHDVRMPGRIVKIFVKCMVHDSLQIRKLALTTISALLKQQKRKHKLEQIDPYNISNTVPNTNCNLLQPGDRADNIWHHYQSESVPKTKAEWESCTFIEKTHWGYYCWPKPMHKYAPTEEQPSIDRTVEELPDDERAIFEEFSNSEFIDKLIRFLSLEEQKGKDKFHAQHFTFFKGLFRNFGDSLLPMFMPHIERLVQDTAHNTHDCSQRCAAEILCGLLRGSKHWSYDKVQKLWQWVIPVLKTGITNMTVETVADWGTCYATVSESRDPRKIAPVLQMLMENPLRGDGGSFGDSSRLYLLQGALAQQEWRVPELLHKSMEYCQPFLAHSYKSVRDRLGSFLANLFLCDTSVPGGVGTTSPHKSSFLQYVLPQLCLLLELPTNANGNNVSSSDDQDMKDITHQKEANMEVDISDIKPEMKNNVNNCLHDSTDEKKVAIRLCKTVLMWLQGSLRRTPQYLCAETFQLIPILCTLESDTTDDELRGQCITSLHCVSQALLPTNLIPVAIETAQKVAKSGSWHARAAILRYIQVVVFSNLFSVQREDHSRAVQEIVLDLLCDDQVEVREMAAITLGGFLQCGYLMMDDNLVKHFEKLSSTRIKKRGRNKASQSAKMSDLDSPELLVRRHAGVLGLSACVQAFPYDVPQLIPQILMDLGAHLDDPLPIQMTVKKTLSNFKRTHHDNWQDHKQKFTGDQLVVLTDLLVSPNYYA